MREYVDTFAPSPQDPYDPDLDPEAPLPASLERRFANSAIDGSLFGIVRIMLLQPFDPSPPSMVAIIATIPLALLVIYVLPEWLCGRTFGKLITGTKVVRLDGGRPSFVRIVLRTIVRFVPFDSFSFILSGRMSGWHDDWSRTRVIQSRDRFAAMVDRL